jgi:uncharacterized protein YraI
MSLKSKLPIAGLAAAMLLATAAPAVAVTAFATTNVNVRACDDIGCRVVDVLRRGEQVDVDYCRGEWCAVSKRGPNGFVNANYLSRGGDFYDDDDYYFDDGPDVDLYISRPVHRHRHHRFRHYDNFHYGPSFGACVGGPNARFCAFD